MHCSTRARPINQRVNIVGADAQNFTCLGRGEIAIMHHALNEMDQFFPVIRLKRAEALFPEPPHPCCPASLPDVALSCKAKRW